MPQTIPWGESIQYDTGSSNAVAMDNKGNAVRMEDDHEQGS